MLYPINDVREGGLIILYIYSSYLDSTNFIRRKLAAGLRVKYYNIHTLKPSEYLAIALNFYVFLKQAVALDKEVCVAATSPLLLVLILVVSNSELRL